MPEPGWYGGAPKDLRIRKSWGGRPRQDPLESGDYLWDNKDEWKRVLDQELAEASSAAAAPAPVRPPAPPSAPPVVQSTSALSPLLCPLSSAPTALLPTALSPLPCPLCSDFTALFPLRWPFLLPLCPDAERVA